MTSLSHSFWGNDSEILVFKAPSSSKSPIGQQDGDNDDIVFTSSFSCLLNSVVDNQ
jgi:hypothetical protein